MHGTQAQLATLIGRRVALRHVIGERDGRPLVSDAVGELRADGDALVVLTRHGPVRIEQDRVTAVRAVPPAPPRRASLAAIVRLEGLCADAWPALHDVPLGAWRLRAASGFTGRANAALAIGSPGVPLPDALDAVLAFAARHGVAPRVQAPVGSPWDRAIEASGWVLDHAHVAGAEVSVQVVALGDGPVGAATRAEVSDTPGPSWWRLTGGDPPGPARRHVLSAAPDTAFLTVDDLGALRVALVADHAHFSVLTVEPAARRRGVATALMRDGAAWARGRGSRFAVLQVASHNAGALALHAALGFVEHHRYRYLVPPEPPESRSRRNAHSAAPTPPTISASGGHVPPSSTSPPGPVNPKIASTANHA